MKRLQAFLAWCDKRFPPTGVAWLEVTALLAVLIAAMIAIWKFLAADTSQLTEFFRVLAWPAVVCVGLFVFRGPIGQFLSGLSQRIKKVSAFKIELELTEVTAKEVTTPALAGIKSSQAMYVGDSGTQIFAQLTDESRADYVVIDLADGGEWLSSRLFIVAALFEHVRGVRCMVFTEGIGENAGRLVGTASLQDVRWRLAHKFPWFEVALAKALAMAVPYEPAQLLAGFQVFRTDQDSFTPPIANTIAQAFISLLQVKPAHSNEGWLEIHQAPPVWERAEWITQPKLRELLGSSLNISRVADIGERRKQDIVRRVLSCSGPFVAGVNGGKFYELFDRATLLEELAHHSALEGDDEGRKKTE
jgi:hypothetical protein